MKKEKKQPDELITVTRGLSDSLVLTLNEEAKQVLVQSVAYYIACLGGEISSIARDCGFKSTTDFSAEFSMLEGYVHEKISPPHKAALLPLMESIRQIGFAGKPYCVSFALVRVLTKVLLAYQGYLRHGFVATLLSVGLLNDAVPTPVRDAVQKIAISLPPDQEKLPARVQKLACADVMLVSMSSCMRACQAEECNDPCM